jgi:hypothetical protein
MYSVLVICRPVTLGYAVYLGVVIRDTWVATEILGWIRYSEITSYVGGCPHECLFIYYSLEQLVYESL